MKEQLIQKIEQCSDLPSLPAIAVQVLELAKSPEIELSEIGELISKDPALSGKILRTVNSSFYGRSQHVATVSHALAILGLQSVKTLVLGFSLVGHLTREGSGGFDYLGYWKRSIYAANAARTIASRVGVLQQEEVFLAALLQDIGMLVLERVLGPAYGSVCASVASHADLSAAEAASLGLHHGEVGKLLAGQWKLPPLLAIPIGCHVQPASLADPALRRLTELVSLAGQCADVFVGQPTASAIALVRTQCKDLFNMAEADCNAMLEGIGRSTREVATLFEINIGQGLTFDDVLKKANEALIEMTLRSQQQANSLRRQNQELRAVASTDSLTGLANRGKLDQFITEAFTAAQRDNKPLSLILLDVDRFKSINDKYGHPAGDLVLKAIASVIASASRATDLAARFGGEEMALVLPGTPRNTASTIAEGIRRAVAAKLISCTIAEVSVTASFGVAAFDPALPFKDPIQLLKAADMAVYAAKNSGRNCVKVFTPKPTPLSNKAA